MPLTLALALALTLALVLTLTLTLTLMLALVLDLSLLLALPVCRPGRDAFLTRAPLHPDVIELLNKVAAVLRVVAGAMAVSLKASLRTAAGKVIHLPKAHGDSDFLWPCSCFFRVLVVLLAKYRQRGVCPPRFT